LELGCINLLILPQLHLRTVFQADLCQYPWLTEDWILRRVAYRQGCCASLNRTAAIAPPIFSLLRAILL
jgi:hypothetical protein